MFFLQKVQRNSGALGCRHFRSDNNLTLFISEAKKLKKFTGGNLESRLIRHDVATKRVQLFLIGATVCDWSVSEDSANMCCVPSNYQRDIQFVIKN